jgi:hypothetical protein
MIRYVAAEEEATILCTSIKDKRHQSEIALSVFGRSILVFYS